MKTYKNNYMESIDFIKLAVYCVERYKESHNTDRSKYPKIRKQSQWQSQLQ